eukprot:1967154-Rhodomonas_salina.2
MLVTAVGAVTSTGRAAWGPETETQKLLLLAQPYRARPRSELEFLANKCKYPGSHGRSANVTQ